MDIASLPSIDLSDRLTLEEGGAVYFILGTDGQPLYIGSTAHLKTRLGCHKVVKGSPDNGAVRVAWFKCDWRLGLAIEADLIFEMQPPLNVRGKTYRTVPVIPPNLGGLYDSPESVWRAIEAWRQSRAA